LISARGKEFVSQRSRKKDLELAAGQLGFVVEMRDDERESMGALAVRVPREGRIDRVQVEEPQDHGPLDGAFERSGGEIAGDVEQRARDCADGDAVVNGDLEVAETGGAVNGNARTP